jgi:coenzyme F420-0:L-glutamate ligase/coenzyme F420-1:gamma-L-glutamate ligase
VGSVRLELIGLSGIPDVGPGDDLAAILVGQAGLDRLAQRGDVLVVAQKIVSKAEGRIVPLSSVKPGPEALALAQELGKDPALVQIILQESRQVIRKGHGVLIVEDRRGIICANAGVDRSNVGNSGDEVVLLLPENPDLSAQRLSQRLASMLGFPVPVIVSDTHGRPFREGAVGIALGCHGLPALLDLRGHKDRYGRVLQSTVVAVADMIASAANLIMGQADEGIPAVLVRGLTLEGEPTPAFALIREPELDLFR